ncbi:hypothetical protein AGMMS49545_03920 [Betaproteobacteria bacterium]|nr:hypothetical protein AGMMS49545_03920 [Betaproteobacteria bacterium]GHU41823.1 hypothetical protein AGMMS50289_05600 [Betaproteobacteria bacterium]
MNAIATIAVLGGGPAGVTAAIGLARLGYAVILLTTPRRFAALEGVSDRVAEGLKNAGLTTALATLAPPSPRRVRWNGMDSAANHERLIYRPDFDAALLDDAVRQGVETLAAQVKTWTTEAAKVRIDYLQNGKAEHLYADFVVEARGRAAPHRIPPAARGTESISLLQYWQPTDSRARQKTYVAHSAVQSFADGWAWLAQNQDGRRYLQLTLDVASANLPTKVDLGEFCRARLQSLEIAREFTAGATPVGIPCARPCTPILAGDLLGERYLKIGDAAVAGDPLSGNGIFLALSSALQAPAIIRTLLSAPERAPLAREFHQQRLTGLFYRFARVGRDFYAGESGWRELPFWQSRRRWPDSEPLHPPVTPNDVTIATRPVLDHHSIIAAEVVVTPDQTLGVWRLDDKELAPALKLIQTTRTRDAALRLLIEHLAYSPPRAAELIEWMRRQGWIDFEQSNNEAIRKRQAIA